VIHFAYPLLQIKTYFAIHNIEMIIKLIGLFPQLFELERVQMVAVVDCHQVFAYMHPKLIKRQLIFLA